MDKSNFKKMALMGMASGMLLASQSPVNAETSNNVGVMMAHSCGSGCGGSRGQQQGYHGGGGGSCNSYRGGNGCSSYKNSPNYVAENDDRNYSQSSQETLTESDLESQLNSEGKAIFRGLDPQGKALALKLATQSCKGKNACKGLNSCKTANNSCNGRGSCAGTSPGPFKDKNAAVSVAAQKMAEKRNSLR